MGRLLAKADGTSHGRIAEKKKRFVSPIEEVHVDGTPGRDAIASADSPFFRETLYGNGQGIDEVRGRDDLGYSGSAVWATERGRPFFGGGDDPLHQTELQSGGHQGEDVRAPQDHGGSGVGRTLLRRGSCGVRAEASDTGPSCPHCGPADLRDSQRSIRCPCRRDQGDSQQVSARHGPPRNCPKGPSPPALALLGWNFYGNSSYRQFDRASGWPVSYFVTQTPRRPVGRSQADRGGQNLGTSRNLQEVRRT